MRSSGCEAASLTFRWPYTWRVLFRMKFMFARNRFLVSRAVDAGGGGGALHSFAAAAQGLSPRAGQSMGIQRQNDEGTQARWIAQFEHHINSIKRQAGDNIEYL